MSDPLARIFEPLLRLLLPGPGHRRRTGSARGGTHRRRPASAPSRPRPRPRSGPGREPLRGEDHVLVRPYLLAHERRQADRRRANRRRAAGRRALVLAPRGLDLHARLLPPTEVPA